MKHTKFIPEGFAALAQGVDSVSILERKSLALAKKWSKQLEDRDCTVTPAALRQLFVCWLHGWHSGVRDESFGFFMSVDGKNRTSFAVEIWPLREKPDARTYICDTM